MWKADNLIRGGKVQHHISPLMSPPLAVPIPLEGPTWEQHPRVRLGPPHRAVECEAGEDDVTGHPEGLNLGRDRWCRNCACCKVTAIYGTPGTYRTPLSPNRHQGQWIAWMVRTAVTVASLLHLPQGAEHPLKGFQTFATFPGPDDDGVEPCPEPDAREGAVLLGLTSSSPKMHGAAAASPKSSLAQGHQHHGWGSNPRTTPPAPPQPTPRGWGQPQPLHLA